MASIVACWLAARRSRGNSSGASVHARARPRTLSVPTSTVRAGRIRSRYAQVPPRTAGVIRVYAPGSRGSREGRKELEPSERQPARLPAGSPAALCIRFSGTRLLMTLSRMVSYNSSATCNNPHYQSALRLPKVTCDNVSSPFPAPSAEADTSRSPHPPRCGSYWQALTATLPRRPHPTRPEQPSV